MMVSADTAIDHPVATPFLFVTLSGQTLLAAFTNSLIECTL